MNVSCALGSHCVAVARPGGGIGPGFLLLVVLLIAAAGYGVTRLRRRRRAGRVADSAWRPEGQGPSSTGAVAPSGDRAGPPDAAGPPSPQLTPEDLVRLARAGGLAGACSPGETRGACRPGASTARRAARGARRRPPRGTGRRMGGRDPRPDQAVRPERRCRQRPAARPPRVRVRLPRTQRRRQDDAHPHPARPDAGRRRHDVVARDTGPVRAQPGAGPGRRDRRRAPLPPPPDGPGEPAPARAPREAATRTGGSRGRWPGSASPNAPTTRSPRTRWACASASGWRRAC